MKKPRRLLKAGQLRVDIGKKVGKRVTSQTMKNAPKLATQLLSTLSARSWAELMAKDKTRRGIDQKQLVYIGIHDLAQYWWCAQYSVLKSRENEVTFFKCYLTDRINYSVQLNRIEQLPENPEGWLKVGNDLTNADLAPLLDRQKSIAENAHGATGMAWAAEDGVCYLSASLKGVERQMHEENALSFGLRIAGPEERVPPMLRGEMAEAEFAETYPKLRWNWSWNRYVVVGVPDGLTDEFVYEFKSIQTLDKMRFARPVALSQADLYGLFWQRSQKRVDFHGVRENRTETVVLPVDAARATQTLEKFETVDHGGVPIRPVEWKCGNCECRPNCPLWL